MRASLRVWVYKKKNERYVTKFENISWNWKKSVKGVKCWISGEYDIFTWNQFDDDQDTKPSWYGPVEFDLINPQCCLPRRFYVKSNLVLLGFQKLPKTYLAAQNQGFFQMCKFLKLPFLLFLTLWILFLANSCSQKWQKLSKSMFQSLKMSLR